MHSAHFIVFILSKRIFSQLQAWFHLLRDVFGFWQWRDHFFGLALRGQRAEDDYRDQISSTPQGGTFGFARRGIYVHAPSKQRQRPNNQKRNKCACVCRRNRNQSHPKLVSKSDDLILLEHGSKNDKQAEGGDKQAVINDEDAQAYMSLYRQLRFSTASGVDQKIRALERRMNVATLFRLRTKVLELDARSAHQMLTDRQNQATSSNTAKSITQPQIIDGFGESYPAPSPLPPHFLTRKYDLWLAIQPGPAPAEDLAQAWEQHNALAHLVSTPLIWYNDRSRPA